MIDTKDFCTKTEYFPRKNASTGKYWGIALDIGYSAVKGISPNSVFCFPAFAKVFTGQTLDMGSDNAACIQYKSEDGVIWNVGAMAQDMVSADDSNDSAQSLYTRKRYFSDMFLVLARVGLALGLMENEIDAPGDRPIMLQTGLPPAYLQNDAPLIKQAIAKTHTFEVRTGKGQWKKFSFSLTGDNIRVMAQPMGSFFSAVLSNEAKPTLDANALLNSNVLVFDAGFGTVDIYSIRNRQIDNTANSYNDCGMKAVFQETAKLIQTNFGVEIKPHTMQKALQLGTVTQFNIFDMSSDDVAFGHLLEEANKKVCQIALDHMKNAYNFLMEYDYLLVTGGTGAAWYDLICDHFARMKTLKIITGSKNDQLSHIYSNVRGYYLHQAGKLRQRS